MCIIIQLWLAVLKLLCGSVLWLYLYMCRHVPLCDMQISGITATYTQ